MDKLKSLPNVDPLIVNWIQDFLTSRNQRVVVKSVESTTLAVTEYELLQYNPADGASMQELETVQNRAIRFVKSIKGRYGITEGLTALGLQELEDRRKAHRFTQTTKIFSEDKKTRSNLLNL